MPFELRGPPEEAAQQLIRHLQAPGVLNARGEVQPQRAQGASGYAETLLVSLACREEELIGLSSPRWIDSKSDYLRAHDRYSTQHGPLRAYDIGFSPWAAYEFSCNST